MLEDIKTKVQVDIDAGKTLQQVQVNTSITAPYNDTLRGGFISSEQILGFFYKSLKKQHLFALKYLIIVSTSHLKSKKTLSLGSEFFLILDVMLIL